MRHEASRGRRAAATILARFALHLALATALASLAALTAGCDAGGSATDRAGEGAGADSGAGSGIANDSAVADPHSYSRPDEIATDALKLDLVVDFEARTLSGTASLRLDRRSPDATEVVLDTRDLAIRSVRLDDATTEADWELGEARPYMGRPLTVAVEPGTEWVHVDYATDPGAAALQWLTPEQTAAGTDPFLLSQSQAILARTWVPCQDSPGVRFTYEARLRVPPGLLALMSASNPTETSDDGVYTFRMDQAVPAYLMAIAVGRLEFRALGEDAGVYAEPPVVEAAAYEFAETGAMIDIAERLYGPYRWDRYDILVLPPSFPFGGMENPRLTFATPTILAGDRSLVALIAHELAHSWSGNLVTNATWNDFWLNEGFTVYFERRIMEALKGRAYSEMLALLGRQDLEVEIERLPAADESLLLDLQGRDPDEGMTDVAYEKGYLFLRLLEERFGRERFDAYLRDYFERNAFRTMTTAEFVADLKARLFAGAGDPDAVAAELRLDEWLHGEGVPDNAPRIESPAFARVEEAARRFAGGAAAESLPTGDWSSHEWQHFLRALPRDLDTERLAALDRAYGLSGTGNSEVRFSWLMLAVSAGYEPAQPSLEAFLTGMGRRKFLRPLYTNLARTPEGQAEARKIYAEARPGYHPVAQESIDAVLGWAE